MTKCTPLSLVIWSGILYLVTICAYKNRAVLRAMLSGKALASPYLVRYSVSTTIYLRRCRLLGFKGPTKSKPHCSNSYCGCERKRGMKSLLRGFPARWQVSHPITHSRASVCRVGHHRPARSTFLAVASGPICPPANPSCASFSTPRISSSMTHLLKIWSGPILYRSPLISWKVLLFSANFLRSPKGISLGNVEVDRYWPIFSYQVGSIAIWNKCASGKFLFTPSAG